MKSKKRTKKKTAVGQEHPQIFFIITSSIVVVLGITIVPFFLSRNSKEKVLGQEVIAMPSIEIPDIANTQGGIQNSPNNSTKINTINQDTTSVNGVPMKQPTPSFVCVGSVGGICPTVPQGQTGNVGINPMISNNPTTTTGTGNCGSSWQQMFAQFVQMLNSLFGISIGVPASPPCTVTPPPVTTIPVITPKPTVITMPSISSLPSISQMPLSISPTIPLVSVTGLPITASPAVTPVANVTVFPQPEGLTNWAGYVYHLPTGATGATLRSTWKVSQTTCTQDGNISPWIGFGGYSQGDHNIAQLGIDFQCINGQPIYATWTEAFPATSIYYDNDIASAGDEISQSITFQGNGSFLTKMTNTTKGWSLSVPMSFEAGYVPVTGDVISEIVFGAVPSYTPQTHFTNNFYSHNGEAEKPLVTASGIARMEIGSNGVQKTQTSALTTTGFTISNK